MQNNDVELRFPCRECALGKASQLALVKIRKSMTKENRRIKGSFLKEVENKTEVKVGNYCKGRAYFPLKELRTLVRTKAENFWEGKHSFLMENQS